jgi:anti-sigma factor RsiW
MNCPDLETIERYVSGRLTAAEHTEFEKHIEICPVCRAAAGEARQNKLLLDELRTFGKDNRVSAQQGKIRVDTVARAQEILGDRYKVVRKVGAGSSGAVFQVLDTTLDRPAAVKVLYESSDTQADT